MKNAKTIVFVIVLLMIGCRGGDAGSQTVSGEAPQPVVAPPPPPPPVYDVVKMADGHEMVRVAAGEFARGSESGERDERPVKNIFVSEFLIDRYEVSNAEYAKCVAAKKCKAAPVKESFMEAEQPVSGLSWDMARAYCSFAGERLPTEAEWEKAARGKDGRVFPWGNDPAPNTATFAAKVTSPVTSNPDGASPYGALNMAGNAAEWVSDWYAEDYYASAPAQDPKGPTAGKFHILRGGSFMASRSHTRAAYRLYEHPQYQMPGYGVRCAE